VSEPPGYRVQDLFDRAVVPPRRGSVNPELRGDVETIVAKALAKDPARRYQSAAELAADRRTSVRAATPVVAGSIAAGLPGQAGSPRSRRRSRYSSASSPS
jgi:hypothetical protein